jgi:Phage capsid family
MATLANNVLTLADWAKRLDPNGNTADIVELLRQTNPILNDMQWMEGNMATGHVVTQRTGLPTVYWRMINQGIPPSKSATAQVTEGMGMLEAWSEVDKDLLKLNGNANSFRLSEGQAFIEAMNNEMAQTLFYGNTGLAPEEFTGLSPRYSTLVVATTPAAENVIGAGGTGSDNTSIWFVVWGPNTIFGVFPKGSAAGLQHEDFGEQTVEVSAGVGGNRMRAMQERWQWKAGIALRDWRYVVRIANIDVSDLGGGSAAALTTKMILAFHRIPSYGMGRAVIYMNRTAAQYLDLQGRADIAAGFGLTYETIDGKVRTSFRGIPIEVTDAILDTEAAVV